MRISIIQPVSTPVDLSSEELEGLCKNGITCSVVNLNTGPISVESRTDKAFAIPGLIAAAQREAQKGADAIVIDCFGDPGLDALREVVDIPVLGVAQTSMNICASLADTFGVVTILNASIPIIKDSVKAYGHDGRFVGCHAIDMRSLEIKGEVDEMTNRLAEHALALVRDKGAHSIILGCTGFIGCAEEIKKRLERSGFDVPVVDPMPATVFSAIPLLRLSLKQSRESYPRSAIKETKGYTEFE
ncbi:hydantoin racemase [Nannizzia gypsea CBS 118893]|uniref:Hydantoin racemase n=1 Tax=Arthroderma gypseum (strain ATCC MYA-4604 / CBS 118893) TaxID=535722 RepID=E4V774_ARTGP|nr:hydantoin racemase [Nannizzia gypsea CBS 118893]EFQ96940.1 hydantoin racemase [Nannizzia gypsea CBS 118893]